MENENLIKSAKIKKMLYELGADLCGIANIERFDESPQGFHPCDVLPTCKSVIVFARRSLAGAVQCKTTIPYTIVRNVLSAKMDKMAVQFCLDLEDMGVVAVPTGTNGPSEFDIITNRIRGIVSAKHCAAAAGLGRIGKNTLLITPEYGNMVWLSVILTDLALEPDSIIEGNPCAENCNLCREICPVHAIGETELTQLDCWNHAFSTDGGIFKIKCNKCRIICPYCYGTCNRPNK